jgi:hypothetical protein
MWLNRFWSIARLVWEQQPRIQGAAADARRCPLTLLLCLIESSRGSLPATSTTDIPGCERSQETKTQPCPIRQRQAAKVGSVEFRSGVAEATSRFWTEYHSGACFLSRIDPKLDRVANEKTCCGEILFRGVRFSFAPHRHNCVRRRGALWCTSGMCQPRAISHRRCTMVQMGWRSIESLLQHLERGL